MRDEPSVKRKRLRRAVANARTLADELARRDTGGRWTRNVTIRTEFGEVPVKTAPARAPDDAGGTTMRRAAVVGWDLSHNPAGRAMVLADLHLQSMEVDVVGPLWSRFGTRVWSPIEQEGYRAVTFRCDRLDDFMAKAYAVASHRTYELVHVCKPRLPGLVLGTMIARASDCPIIVDIDDEEMAFFADADADADDIDVGTLDLDDLREPTEAVGTARGVALARGAGVRTVSNVELRRGYGGITVRHARSEVAFDPSAVSRVAGRSRLGAAPDDFVVLFVGTPRPHKGLDVVVDALRRLDDRFVLHIVGVTNPVRFEEEIDTTGVRVVTHRPTEIAILPELIAAGDAIALMQDLDDPIAAYQIPSKIADGLSMGCPVIVTDAPPLRDLTDHGLLRADDAAGLARHLERLAGGESSDEARTRRDAFLSEFSVRVNAARVRLAESEAVAVHAAGTDPVLAPTLDLARRAYVHERRRVRPDLFGEPEPRRDEGADIVVFWKQNDTGIYGRRSDMLTKYFGADPRIRRVLHLDAPLSTERAARDAEVSFESGTDHERLCSLALMDRRLEIIESGPVHHRTFLYTEDRASDPMTGEGLPPREGFGDFVREQLSALDMDPSRTLAWVCPVLFDFPDVHRQLGFGAVVCDIIDDERVFSHPRHPVEQIDRHYEELLRLGGRAFTNCEANVDAFDVYAPEISVVPNGAETTAFSPERSPWDEDPAPVVAYTGNLKDRIDWGLLDDLAQLRPDHRFLMVGAAHGEVEVHELVRRHPNVELVGVVPYASLPEFLQGVDVALVPHLAGMMTDRMNPLKIYNYYAAGLPIVSTPIPNIDELADSVTIAGDAPGFAAAIDEGVVQRRSGEVARDQGLLDSIDWSTRATAILDQLEADGLLSAPKV